MPLLSTLKDHCVQHLPDGSVTVESILIQAAAHSEDPGTKVLLVSWTYQVRSMGITITPVGLTSLELCCLQCLTVAPFLTG
jgi:hypothetical protein